jgi:hypothetical protein
LIDSYDRSGEMNMLPQICAVEECDNYAFPNSPYCEEHTNPEDLLECKAAEILKLIRQNRELYDRELGGFVEGERRGKKPNVSIEVLFKALEKQFADLKQDYSLCDPCWVGRAKKDLADIRNVAGVLFLVLEGKNVASLTRSGE